MADDISDVIKKSLRYVAFMDVLGYGHIVTGKLSEERKFKRLRSLFENLATVILIALGDANKSIKPKDPQYIESVCFSDSFYFSSRDLPSLLFFLEQIFSDTYGYQESTYHEDADNWIPFIRAGVVYGWAISFRDVTLRKISPPDAVFRNPVGPAVAEAYWLTECEGKLPGMRCYMEKALLGKVTTEHIEDPPHYKLLCQNQNRMLRLLDVPPGQAKRKGLRLVELCWPCRVISGNNVTFYEPLTSVQRQFLEPDGHRHYKATKDLFDRSVQICGDCEAKRIWRSQEGKLLLRK